MNKIRRRRDGCKGILRLLPRRRESNIRTAMDMAMIYSESRCRSAGTFTTNIVKAAPVKWDKNQVTAGARCQGTWLSTQESPTPAPEKEGMGYCGQTAEARPRSLWKCRMKAFWWLPPA
ncbi:MAG: bifunctional ornithine acetyltransferase/N-acetylglutamate synthase [Enterocloster bolteae]